MNKTGQAQVGSLVGRQAINSTGRWAITYTCAECSAARRNWAHAGPPSKDDRVQGNKKYEKRKAGEAQKSAKNNKQQ